MKTKFTSQNRSAGFALLLVLIMCLISLIIMVAVMNRTSAVSKLNDRSNKYATCCTAAEAAAEKVFARMAYDFQNYGLGQVTNNWSAGVYQTNVPNAAEGSYWTKFVFFDAQTGATNHIYVNFLTNYAGPLPSQYTNISTITAPIYRITANASMADTPDIVGTAQEDVLLSLVPITTYAIFYNGPLEFTQCATMNVRGRTHANDIICVGTSASLTFNSIVTSTKTVDGPTRDGVTPSPWNQNTTFNGSYSTNVASVTVAMNMTNSHALIEIPPPGEDPTSILGAQKLYNQAHVLVLITNMLPAVTGTNSHPVPQPFVTISLHSSYNGVVPGADILTNGYIWNYFYTNMVYTTNMSPPIYFITNGVFTNYPGSAYLTNEPTNIGTWLSLTNTFSDLREYQTNMFVTQIDIGAYASWLTNTLQVTNKFNSGTLPTILFVADQRNVGTNKLSVVRLINGSRLPVNNGRGFSVATPNPLYVKGNYNVTADGTHYALIPDSTTNAGTTVPAALLCDAITVLSTSFNDISSKTTTGSATVSNVLNAAVITGNVPTTGTNETTFSGGVHNLMRMQEDWTANNSVLVLNTSIVVLFASQMATNQFRNPIGWSGVVNPYYKPPTRQWGFDPNFYNPTKQPPGIPTALVPIRFNWAIPPPNSVSSDVGNW